MDCDCNNENLVALTNNSIKKNLPPLHLSDFLVCLIPFGAVPVGNTAIETFTIKNERKKSKIYIISRSPNINSIYYAFAINKDKVILKPDEEFELKITYKPNVRDIPNLTYFYIRDDEFTVLQKLCIRGQAIGPVIRSSVTSLDFYITLNHNDKKKVFELLNTSEIPAIYQFDENEKEKIFQVDALTGTIPPLKHIYVAIKFSPKKSGVYYKQLCCLILNCEPIIINLLGVYMPEDSADSKKMIFNYYPFPVKEKTGFKGYMSDSTIIKTVIPPVSLSDNNFDFGRVLCGEKNIVNTSLTNHLKSEVIVIWEKDKVFQINPKTAKVLPNDSILFECTFAPDVEDTLFTKILNGQILWNNPDQSQDFIEVPISINLRLIGHSFPENHFWISQVQVIPENIVLAIALPNYPTWTTFIIKSKGHLPVMFKLLPPKKTHFIMKPMVGVITTYQLIVVQLQVIELQNQLFTEQWCIELNGQADRLLPIYVKGQCDLPVLIIGKNNVVQFDSVQPGCRTVNYVPVKNSSSCQLQYEFILKDKDYFIIEPIRGELARHEEIFIDWSYIGQLNIPTKLEILCKIRVIQQNNLIVGYPFETYVTVQTNCCYSELCACPRSYETGELIYDSEIKTHFYLYNFGESAVNFELNAYDNRTKNKIHHDMSFLPKRAKVEPKQKLNVSIILRVTELGKNSFTVLYSTKTFEYSNESTGKPIEIFTISYEGVYPTIQIEEIVEHNFGHLFTKVDLWEKFDVVKINQILKKIVQGETKHINLYVPDSDPNETLYYVTFLLKNTTNIDTEITLKRKKICDCTFKQVAKSFTLTKRVLDCPHREILTMTITDQNILVSTVMVKTKVMSYPILQPKIHYIRPVMRGEFWVTESDTTLLLTINAHSTQLLSIEIKYFLPNTSTMRYILSLSNERRIEIDIIVNTIIPNDFTLLSTYSSGYEMFLENIFIGLQEPPLQTFWLYNNTENQLKFRLDDVQIIELCDQEGFEVLKCLNCDNIIEPYSRTAILFKFLPIEVKTYKVVTSLIYAEEIIEFKIEGKGIGHYECNVNKKQEGIMPVRSKTNNSNFPIKLSLDHLVVEPFPVWRSIEKLLFINNVTENTAYKYCWQSNFIQGIIHVDVIKNKEGILQPNNSNAIVIKITSVFQPCFTRLTLACKLLDYTQQLRHEQSKLEYEQKAKELEGQFTITEKGIEYPVLDYKILPPPEDMFIALAITVTTLSTLDSDLYLHSGHSLNYSPFDNICLNENKYYDNMWNEINVENQPNDKIIRKTVESLIADVVFTDVFHKIMKEIKEQPSPLYCQVKRELSEAKRPKTLAEHRKKPTRLEGDERNLFFKTPQLSEISDAFKKLILDSVNETFKLEEEFDDNFI